jgi:hypothetical protein
MRIIFKTPGGDSYSAELEDNKLSDIRKIDNSESSGRGGGSMPPDPSESRRPGTQPAEQDGSKEEMGREGSGGGGNPPSAEDRVFIDQLTAVLVNNRARKQLRHKSKGLLDSRAFVKTQVDSPSVFRQNNRKDSQRNYSVVLLVDESGSMDGEKANLAQELTQSIATNLDRVGGVEVAVLGFSGNRVVEHKRFDNSGHNSLCCISQFAHDGYHCQIGSRIQDEKSSDCENADLIAMEYALSYLNDNHAPDSKQVFIMLSDGAPCGSDDSIVVVGTDLRRKTFDSKFTRKVPGNRRDISHMHQLLKLFPDVNSFGLGMFQGGQQVPKHVIVKDLKHTKQVLLNFLRTAIN